MADAETVAIGMRPESRTLDMATAELRPPSHAGPSPEISHPLERLRVTIHRFVVFEGLVLAGIVPAPWFWIGLLLDFRIFKLFYFAWVQEAPRGLRGALLAAVIAALGG